LQTTAGKMIFGKWDERTTGRHDSKSAATAPLVIPPVTVPPPTGSSAPPSEAPKKPPSVVDRVAD
jgi:hypothetical protein